MLKMILLVTTLLFTSIASHADIIDLGNITRDTATGLDWLDVTETRGLSVDDVRSQMGAGGDFDGWRYALGFEWDILITNFGYVGVTTCFSDGQYQYCDRGIPGDNPLIEYMIKTLGDTRDAYYDETDNVLDTISSGAGYVIGRLGEDVGAPFSSHFSGAAIIDNEYVNRLDLLPASDGLDTVNTIRVDFDDSSVKDGWTGSWLVRSSFETPVTVPLPAAVYLFSFGIVALFGMTRRYR